MANNLQPGQSLFSNQSIRSNDGRFEFIMQSDGNLVLYRLVNHFPLWATGTNGRDVQRAIMQGDGNLVLYNFRGGAVWASRTHGNPGAFLVLQDDGNVVIYKPHHAIWATGTNQ